MTGTYDPGATYTVMTAQGGVSGTFNGVSSDFAFLNATLGYTANAVTLSLTRNDIDFADVGETRNQRTTANALDSLQFGNNLYDKVVQLDAASAKLAFDGLSGEIHASAITADAQTALLVQGAVLDRLRSFGAPSGTFGLNGATVTGAFAADLPGGRRPELAAVPLQVLDPRAFALWGQGFGAFGKTSRDGNAGTLTRNTGGFIVGADVKLDGRFVLGLAGGYTDTNLNLRSRTSTGDVTSGFGAVYGAARFGAVNVRLGGIFADNETRTTRSVAFPGFSDSLSAKAGGETLQAFGEAGYQVPLGAAMLEPFAGLASIHIGRDRVTERGGAASLTLLGRDYGIQTMTAGLRGQMAFGPGSPLSLKATIGYRHAFGDVVPAALMAFTSGSSLFQSAGIPVDRNAVVAEAGLDWQIASGMTLGLAYTGQAGRRAQDHGARGSFIWKF